tara:strand:- start:134 stop:412 length:279 start_codon:yes stop_codon:yes gene_type:complete
MDADGVKPVEVTLPTDGATSKEGRGLTDVVASTFMMLDRFPSLSSATKYTSYAVLAERDVMAEKLLVNGELDTVSLAAFGAGKLPELCPSFN